jgi:hypothetical protein
LEKKKAKHLKSRGNLIFNVIIKITSLEFQKHVSKFQDHSQKNTQRDAYIKNNSKELRLSS